jgi:hypothetical protein
MLYSSVDMHFDFGGCLGVTNVKKTSKTSPRKRASRVGGVVLES